MKDGNFHIIVEDSERCEGCEHHTGDAIENNQMLDKDNRYSDTKSLDKQERNNENHSQNNESIG